MPPLILYFEHGHYTLLIVWALNEGWSTLSIKLPKIASSSSQLKLQCKRSYISRYTRVYVPECFWMQRLRKEWLEGSPMLEVTEQRLSICRCSLLCWSSKPESTSISEFYLVLRVQLCVLRLLVVSYVRHLLHIKWLISHLQLPGRIMKPCSWQGLAC